jgi:hypothetical protein
MRFSRSESVNTSILTEQSFNFIIFNVDHFLATEVLLELGLNSPEI